MTDPAARPEGWYPDPYAPSNRRWWSGTEWTGSVEAAVAVAVAPQLPSEAQPADASKTTTAGTLAESALFLAIVSCIVNPLFLASIAAFFRIRQARSFVDIDTPTALTYLKTSRVLFVIGLLPGLLYTVGIVAVCVPGLIPYRG